MLNIFVGYNKQPKKKPQKKQLAGAPICAPIPVPKKRGRPPKGDRAMTAAERKANQRMMDRVEEIQNEHHDNKGRLTGERSGEAPRKFGESEPERIIGQQDIQESIGGKRISPASNPDESDYVKPTTGKGALDKKKASNVEQTHHERIGEAIKKVAKDCVVGGTCSICGEEVTDKEAERHIRKAFERAEKAWYDYESLTNDKHDLFNPEAARNESIEEELLKASINPHHKAVMNERNT